MWLPSALSLLLLLASSVKSDERVKLKRISSRRWTSDEEKPIVVDSTISNDRVHLGYLTCAQKLPYGLSCNVTVSSVNLNDSDDETTKTCGFEHFLAHGIQLHNAELKTLPTGIVLLTFPTSIVNLDYVADGLEVRAIDMDKCDYHQNAIVTNSPAAKPFAVITRESRYDVIAYASELECEQQYCLFTYDYAGELLRDSVPFLGKEDTRELEVFGEDSGKGYFAVSRGDAGCNVYAVNEDGSANQSMRYKLDVGKVFGEVHYASEHEVVSMIWQEKDSRKYRFVRFDKDAKLAGSGKLEIESTARILSVCNSQSGDLLVWTVKKIDDFTIQKDYSILRIDERGKVARAFDYYDLESTLNEKSSVKLGKLREINAKLCFAIYYEVNAKSQLYNEHRWDVKCVDASSAQ